MKYAVVILDGAADEPNECYGGKTALEYSNTPFLDLLARDGATGMSKNVPDGMEPASNIACMSIMGYDPKRYDIGRGAIEGASLGISLDADEIAMRMNLCNVQDGIMHSYSTDNITTESSHELADELAAALDDDTFQIVKGVGFRHILRVKGHPELMGLKYWPAHNITDQPIEGHWPSGDGADLICDYMRRAADVLATSEANAKREREGLMRATNAWCFWPGMRPQGMEPFSKVYGVQAGMLSAVDLLNGLAEMTGMRRYTSAGITDGPDNDFASQGKKAVEMLEENDIIFVHVEAPDTAGHDGSPKNKVDAIESIDRDIVAPLIDVADAYDLAILAMPDHPTPLALKTHSRGMVPFVMWGDGIEASRGVRLTEKEGATSGIVMDPGCGLMQHFLDRKL